MRGWRASKTGTVHSQLLRRCRVRSSCPQRFGISRNVFALGSRDELQDTNVTITSPDVGNERDRVSRANRQAGPKNPGGEEDSQPMSRTMGSSLIVAEER